MLATPITAQAPPPLPFAASAPRPRTESRASGFADLFDQADCASEAAGAAVERPRTPRPTRDRLNTAVVVALPVVAAVPPPPPRALMPTANAAAADTPARLISKPFAMPPDLRFASAAACEAPSPSPAPAPPPAAVPVAPEAFALQLKPVERTPAPAEHAEPELPRTKSEVKAASNVEKPAPAPERPSHKEERGDRDDDRAPEPAPAAPRAVVAPTHPEATDAHTRPAAIVTPAAPLKSEPPSTRPERAPEPPAVRAETVDAPETKPVARPAHEIALHIGASAESKVEVRVVERAGEVHVSVRTPDATLAREMRDDLGSLTGKLAHAGYETAAAGNDSPSFGREHDSRNDQHPGERQGSNTGGSGQQQQREQDEGRGRRSPWSDSFSELFLHRRFEDTTHDHAAR